MGCLCSKSSVSDPLNSSKKSMPKNEQPKKLNDGSYSPPIDNEERRERMKEAAEARLKTFQQGGGGEEAKKKAKKLEEYEKKNQALGNSEGGLKWTMN